LQYGIQVKFCPFKGNLNNLHLTQEA
jgi:hypothetical protein